MNGKLALLVCLVFITLAIPWIDKPGMQTDEVHFAAAIYPPFDPAYTVRIFGHNYSMMIMSYVGGLKARIWSVIFRIWPPSPASVRIPAVVLGALSIWWMFVLLRRTVGARAALAGTALVATDPLYILNSRWDHGPTAIQHVCLVGSMLAFVRFYESRRAIWLAAGFFAWGLALWDKAVAAWMLAGLAAAALVVFPRQIREVFRWRWAAIGLGAAAIGALPLIIVNYRTNLSTFHGTAQWSTEGLPQKIHLLRDTLEGSGIFGEVMRASSDGPLREPQTWGEKMTVRISLAAGMPQRSLNGYLALAALAVLPLVWRSPAGTLARFVMVAVAVGWLPMAFTKGAGFAVHHTILLWPLPAMGMAAVLGTMRMPRAALIALIAVACAANLLVLSTYYTNLLRNGGTASWTDAMYPAFEAIHTMPKEAVCPIDWGFFDSLRMVERGRLPMCVAAEPGEAELDQISHPGYVFLTHTDGNEQYPGINARFLSYAESQGFEKVNRQVFKDSNGREMVEIFQLARR